VLHPLDEGRNTIPKAPLLKHGHFLSTSESSSTPLCPYLFTEGLNFTLVFCLQSVLLVLSTCSYIGIVEKVIVCKQFLLLQSIVNNVDYSHAYKIFQNFD